MYERRHRERKSRRMSGWMAALGGAAVWAVLFSAGAPHLARGADEAAADAGPQYTTHSLRGRVVWLAEAMQRLFGVELDPDAEQAMVALETPEGTLHPIAKDGRGRGFHLDPRMRDIDMELFVRQYAGAPLMQVIQVYTLKPEGKFEFDYWCDICAIPMYELKPCECCQQEIRIRERQVD